MVGMPIRPHTNPDHFLLRRTVALGRKLRVLKEVS